MFGRLSFSKAFPGVRQPQAAGQLESPTAAASDNDEAADGDEDTEATFWHTPGSEKLEPRGGD